MALSPDCSRTSWPLAGAWRQPEYMCVCVHGCVCVHVLWCHYGHPIIPSLQEFHVLSLYILQATVVLHSDQSST